MWVVVIASVISCADEPPMSVTQVERTFEDVGLDMNQFFQRGHQQCSTDPFAEVQFAFAGAVTEVEEKLNESRVFAGHEIGISRLPDELRDELVWTWVTFDVVGWYTKDKGTEIKVWMPGLEPVVGQTWLVAGVSHRSHLSDYPGDSGTADRCVTAITSSDQETVWDSHFGGFVVAGSMTPERAPSPERVAEIDQAERQWRASDVADYTVIMAFGGHTSPQSDCSEQAVIRIVVREREPVQGINMLAACEVSLDYVPQPADVFATARAFSGAENFRFEADPNTGFPMLLQASDRSTAVSEFVESFEAEEAHLAVVGWGAVDQSILRGKEQWEASDLDRYELDLQRSGTWFTEDVTVTVDGESISYNDAIWLSQPLTVEDQYTFLAAYNRANPVVAVFDNQFGYLRDVWLDQNLTDLDLQLHARLTPG